MKKHTAILLLGGNQGHRRRMLTSARNQIELHAGRMLEQSSLYETEPWGFQAKQNFLNQVVVIETTCQPRELLEMLLDIEKELGRETAAPGSGYSSRVIDIDILFYDEQIIDTPSLQVPHPQLHKRRFTLEPLREVAPDLLHPVLQKTTTQLLNECQDPSGVHKVKS